MSALYKKELKSMFYEMTAPLFIAYVLLWNGIYTNLYNLANRIPKFEYAVAAASFISLLAVPILTMRSFAEERSRKTDQLLYFLPMRSSGVIAAKYLAMVTVFAIPCAVMALYPLMLSMYGEISFAPAYTTLLAYFLLGAAVIAVCMFISSLTESQVIAAVLSVGVILLSYFMSSFSTMLSSTASHSFVGMLVIAALVALIIYTLTKNAFVGGGFFAIGAVVALIVYLVNSTLYEGLMSKLLAPLSMFTRIDTYVNGMFDICGIVYYLSVIGLFVFFTVQSFEKRRWS